NKKKEIAVRSGVQHFLLVMVAVLLVHATAAISGPTLGGPAPNLKEAVWIKGGPLPEFEPGRIYVVDLWSTWCKPCLKSMPALHKLESQYKDKVTFIALSIWDPEKPQVVEFVEKHGETMPGLIATDLVPPGKEFNEGILAARYLGTTERVSVPRTFIVDRTGNLVWIGLPWDLEVPLEQVVNGTWDWSEFAASWENDLAPKASENSDAN
ncbi:MAG: TlpA family protein disulfide reductase, partial [Bacteroidales bacterium]|nr:TlpA family protein disulfide reductase [Candidatus Latescibacterota bacterium]